MQDARAPCSLAIVKLDSARRCSSRLDKGRRRFDKARRIGNAPPPIGDKYRCTRIHFPRGKKVHPRAARIRISLMKRGFIASVGRCARARAPEGSADAFNAIERAIITNNARAYALDAATRTCPLAVLFVRSFVYLFKSRISSGDAGSARRNRRQPVRASYERRGFGPRASQRAQVQPRICSARALI